MWIAAYRREHHRAAIEVHCALVVAKHGRDRERARLPAEIEELEDVMNPELAERSLDRHYATCRLWKIRSRSADVRDSRRARRARSPSGSSSTTRCQVAIASR